MALCLVLMQTITSGYKISWVTSVLETKFWPLGPSLTEKQLEKTADTTKFTYIPSMETLGKKLVVVIGVNYLLA